MLGSWPLCLLLLPSESDPRESESRSSESSSADLAVLGGTNLLNPDFWFGLLGELSSDFSRGLSWALEAGDFGS